MRYPGATSDSENELSEDEAFGTLVVLFPNPPVSSALILTAPGIGYFRNTRQTRRRQFENVERFQRFQIPTASSRCSCIRPLEY